MPPRFQVLEDSLPIDKSALRGALHELRPSPEVGAESSPVSESVDERVVLVVDDDEVVVDIITEIVAVSGRRVVGAGSIAAAKHEVVASRPDLVVLDLMLPDGDGLTLCPWIRERTSAGILVCSATNRVRDAVLALKIGADDFIGKPFDIDELDARVEALLRRVGWASAAGDTLHSDGLVNRPRASA
jgi:DNA-binding response OmpR family regulator